MGAPATMTRDINVGTLMGLNNRLPLARLEAVLPGRAPGVWLRSATNVDLTANKFLRSRGGYSQTQTVGWHSLWSDDRDAYGVCGGDLTHIDHSTKARTVVVAGVGNERASFARLPDGLVYWTNSARIGRIAGTAMRALVTPTPNPVPTLAATTGGLPPGRYQVCFTALGPDGESASTEPRQLLLPSGGGVSFSGLAADMLVYVTGPDGETFNEAASGDYLSLGNDGAPCETFMLQDMPAGQALAHFRGSLLVARGKWLYVSEPYRYGLLNAGRGFAPFPAEISVVQPCEDGVYVCADRTYWLPGDPLNTTPEVVLPYGALPGSAAFDKREQTAYWQGGQGVVVAKPGGDVTVPQDEALTFRPAESGFTWVREQAGDKHLITTRFGVST